MPAQADLSKLSVRQFAERFRSEMIPLSNTFSYFCASVPLSEEDLKEYLEEPVAALPPAVAQALPKISILLVPYLERANGERTGAKDGARAKPAAAEYVSIEKPLHGRISAATQLSLGGETVLAFALKDQEVAEYHYRFYHLLATVLGEQWTEAVETGYSRMMRDELNSDVHGEVDEASWRLKQALRRSRDVLLQVNAKVSGVLLNAVDLSSPDYYYYYEYKSKYSRYYRDDQSHDDDDGDTENTAEASPNSA